MDNRIAIVGGGLGGLSAAIRLAHSGFQVSLFEQNSSLGGKMNYWKDQGFHFDTGPSLITMPFVLDELFDSVGENRRDYFEMMAIKPVCRYFWADGTVLDTSTDINLMQDELKKISERDAGNYARFLKYTKQIYDITADIFLFNPLHEIKKIASLETLIKFFRIHQIDPFRTVHQGVNRFFGHPKIVQLFDRYATYNGSNPYQAPATLNIIPYVEYGLGSYYIRGGIYRLVTSLEKVAKKLGVEIHTSTRVEKILHRSNQVQGLRVNGETVSIKNVICNSDVVVTFNELIDGFDEKRNSLNRMEPSLSGIVFLWGINSTHAKLAQHNIFFSNDYESEFKQIFESKQVPDDLTVYVAITSKSDSYLAPIHCENWFVLVNVPYLAENQNWSELVRRTRKNILDKLKQHGIDVSSAILTEKVLTPKDFFRLYGSNRGSIYGISSNSKTTAFRRPANRNRELDGLYFAGGSAHPGGGVPLTILSGKLCADLLSEKNEKK